MPAPPTSPPVIGGLDLAAEREELGEALPAALMRVLSSGHFVLGPEVSAFERSFADLCGVPHGVAVASGTDALILALRAVGVGPGDRVLTSPFTFFASAGAIAWVGATPQLADVDPDTALLTTAGAAAALDSSTVAILPVHLYGQMADMRGLGELAQERGVALVEDAAQAHGAERDGLKPGQASDAATFSFYPTKNLGACGEGGMVVTHKDGVAERLAHLRDHGSPGKYQHLSVGTNARMHAFQGAVLNTKLPHLAAWNNRRRAIAQRYDAAFDGHATLVPLKRVDGAVHAYHQYTLRVRGDRQRDDVQAALAARNIHAAVHYPTPVHLQEAAKPWGYGPGDFPVAEALAREVLCLPVHPFLSDPEVDRVAEVLLAL